jgi:ABC-2 type transport system ATP-binding protein
MHGVVARFQSVYKKFKRIEALRGISFELCAGEILSFIGPNGSGKTTTIRHCLGFYKPDSGVVRVLGHDPSTDFGPVGRQLGIMLEQPGLCDHLTASEYLDFFGALFGLSGPLRRERTRELLEVAGLSDRAESKVAEFSKGMRQRLSLARCLINRPRLLLLDEPFDGIDVETRRHILDLLPSLAHEDGAAVLVTSHNLPEVDRISDRIAIISKGRIAALDRPDALRRQRIAANRLVITIGNGPIHEYLEAVKGLHGAAFDPATRQLTIDAEDLRPDDVLRQLLARNISVTSVSEDRPTLEDAYFALTRENGGSSC